MLDYLLSDDKGTYAGKHIIIDVYDAKHLDNLATIETMLTNCANDAGATILHTHCHVFHPSGGISGVIVLAESHISVHTWPEIHYAALDVFMCGNTYPEKCVDVIKHMLETTNVSIKNLRRGGDITKPKQAFGNDTNTSLKNKSINE